MIDRRPPILFKSPTITNRLVLEVLPPLSWKNRPAFLIGGGPSLGGFDFKRLRGHRTIGVNRAYEFFDPTIAFSMDTRFLRWILDGKYGPEATAKFEKTPAYKVWLLTYTASLPADIFVIPVYRNHAWGMDHMSWRMEDGIGHGANSGFGALNLALVLGANPIYLLGFDLDHTNGKSHYHGGHPVPQTIETVRKYRGIFQATAEDIKSHGFKIVNLNKNSGLQCFDFADPEEVL